jgi:hypothetical protein
MVLYILVHVVFDYHSIRIEVRRGEGLYIYIFFKK